MGLRKVSLAFGGAAVLVGASALVSRNFCDYDKERDAMYAQKYGSQNTSLQARARDEIDTLNDTLREPFDALGKEDERYSYLDFSPISCKRLSLSFKNNLNTITVFLGPTSNELVGLYLYSPTNFSPIETYLGNIRVSANSPKSVYTFSVKEIHSNELYIDNCGPGAVLIDAVKNEHSE